MTKHTPATPLPWRVAAVEPSRNPFYPIVGNSFQYVAQVDIHARGGSNLDATYLAHTANAYPKMIEALREVDRISESFDTNTDKGRIALADAMLPLGNVVRDVLRELGETA